MEAEDEDFYTELREDEGMMSGTAKLDGVGVCCFQRLSKCERHERKRRYDDDGDRNEGKEAIILRLFVSCLP